MPLRVRRNMERTDPNLQFAWLRSAETLDYWSFVIIWMREAAHPDRQSGNWSRAADQPALFGAAHELDARLRRLHQAAIDGEIVERHPPCGEARLKLLSDGMPAEPGEAIDGADRAGLILHDEAGQTLVDDLGHRATVIRNYRRTACHRFDHDEAERLWPVDRDQQPNRAAEEVRFFVVADFADVFDQRVALDQRTNEFIVVLLVGPIDLRRDLERNAASGRDLDRPVHALFRRDPAKHAEISRGHRPRHQQLFGQPVMDGAHPIGLQHRTPLRV